MKIQLLPILRPPKKLSVELTHLRLRVAQRAVTIRELLYVLRGRAYMLLVILLTLPFLLPLPLPGLSTPFGFAIIVICLRLALGQRPWLPMSIQRRELPAGFIPRLLDLAAKIIGWLERVLRPRWLVLTEHALIRQLHALVMVAAAAILLLPLPIPFSNGLPAWSILLVASGLLERDGRAITLGYVIFALSVVYLWLFGEAAQELVEAGLGWFRGG
ncbi:MAG: exopolysaccharide biosynthesis protein [bacterium]|nr:exopolysaccharide biosynthesis protein [bacterium]MDI1337181.1 exopolysaccharide biosynthesis protein [Lacunisphaera sp.]